jgi:deoxycytidine triphosphate deaminase
MKNKEEQNKTPLPVPPVDSTGKETTKSGPVAPPPDDTTPIIPPELPGVLTGEEIKNLKLIEPMDQDFIDNCLKATSCDLRLGYEVLICGKNKPIFKKLKEKDPITIESFGRIIFMTKEKVMLYNQDNIVGRFDLMIRHGLDGLILQVGTQVEAGYEGYLFGLLINTQGNSKTLKAGERLLKIEFSRMNRKPSPELIDRKKGEDLDKFLRSQGVHFDRTAEPSVIEKVRDELRDCQLRHGLKRNIEDSKMARRRVWIAVFMILLTIIGWFIAYPEKIVSYKQRLVRNIGMILAEDANQIQEVKKKESLKDNKGAILESKNDSNKIGYDNEINATNRAE